MLFTILTPGTFPVWYNNTWLVHVKFEVFLVCEDTKMYSTCYHWLPRTLEYPSVSYSICFGFVDMLLCCLLLFIQQWHFTVQKAKQHKNSTIAKSILPEMSIYNPWIMRFSLKYTLLLLEYVKSWDCYPNQKNLLLLSTNIT